MGTHPGTVAIRGQALSFRSDPFLHSNQESLRHESDALLLLQDGKITAFGPYDQTRALLPPGAPVTHYRNALILPGFIDAHAHYPQVGIIGAYGKQLIDWLNHYTFAAEERFSDPAHARAHARLYLDECARAGTTTAAVYATVHPQSVDAFFTEAEARGLRMISGKVLMDRNAPEALRDSAQRGYDESKALISRWHGRGRLEYAITPRFAPTSSPEQLELAGALRKEHPGVLVQTHLSENLHEIEWVRELFPKAQDYLEVYERAGLVGPRTLLGHGIHLSASERSRIQASGAAIVHCPTSNEFLGSGLFRLEEFKRAARAARVAIGTDVGAGTSFSMLRTLKSAYSIAQLTGYSLSPARAFYLATRGAAEALGLAGQIGSLEPGMEADLVVLDLESTPLIAARMQECRSLEEALFIQMILGDERATRATYVAGALAYQKPEQQEPATAPARSTYFA